METSRRNRFRMFGSVKTYVAFARRYSFRIGTDYVLDLPTGKEDDGSDRFELVGEVQTNDFQVAKSGALVTLDDFLSKLSIFYNVPIEDLNISDVRFERNGASNITTSERSAKVKGSIAVNDTNIACFEKVLGDRIDSYILSMFKRCRSENPDISFWTIYDILQILVGERKDIDRYLKTTFPDLEILHNDTKNQDNTILIAIRDSFSHKTIYSGQPIDVWSKLALNIDRFRDIARATIIDKLGIKLYC